MRKLTQPLFTSLNGAGHDTRRVVAALLAGH